MSDVREVKFRVRTEKHDLDHKMKKVQELLEKGERVKLVVTMRGRELAHPDIAEKTLDTLISLCPGNTLIGEIKHEPRALTAMVKFRQSDVLRR